MPDSFAYYLLFRKSMKAMCQFFIFSQPHFMRPVDVRGIMQVTLIVAKG